MRKFIIATLVLIFLAGISMARGEKKQVNPAFAWANGMLYGANNPTSYAPDNGPRNILLIFQGLKGQRPVAEAGPGDINYQNGRWQVVILEFTPEGKKVFDINNDGFSEFEITNWDMAQHYLNVHGFLKVVGRGSAFDAPLVRPKGLEPPDK